MSDDFSLIPLDETIKTLRLDRHFHDRTTLDQYETADQRIAEVEADPERFPNIDVNSGTWRLRIISSQGPSRALREADKSSGWAIWRSSHRGPH